MKRIPLFDRQSGGQVGWVEVQDDFAEQMAAMMVDGLEFKMGGSFIMPHKAPMSLTIEPIPVEPAIEGLDKN